MFVKHETGFMDLLGGLLFSSAGLGEGKWILVSLFVRKKKQKVLENPYLCTGQGEGRGLCPGM